jgi:hypothetical protein
MSENNSTHAIPEKIMKRIEKLLRLSESPNQAEAEAAAAKARQLLVEYNLKAEDVVSSGEPGPKVGEDVVGGLKQNVQDWEIRLANGIAHAFFSRVLVGPNRIHFVGRSTDVQVTIYTFNALRVQIQAMADRDVQEYVEKLRGEGHALPWSVRGDRNPNTWKSAYLKGAAEGVAAKLQEERRADAVTVTALAVRRSEEISSYLADQYGGRLGTHKGQQAKHWSGYAAGFVAGKGMQVHKGIESFATAGFVEG